MTGGGREPNPGFLADVHFHDTRHEAASRLANKLSNVLELSAVTGHKRQERTRQLRQRIFANYVNVRI
jgi:integrase